MNAIESAPPADVPVRTLAQIIRRDRTLILVITGIFTIIAAVGAWLSEKEYKASVMFSFTADSHSGAGGGAAGGIGSQFGALASLAGLSVGAGGEKYEALALLQSRSLTEMFIQQNDLLPLLYWKLWDPKTHGWLTQDPQKIPTLWKADLEFRKIRTVVQDTKTGLVTLSITWRDPVLAAKWANGIVQLTNAQMRARAIRDSERNIAYLREQAATTQLVPVQTALSNLMESEYKQSMLAGGNDEYAMKVIDPAAVPEQPSSIRRIYIILGGVLGGLFVSLLIVFARSSGRGER